MQEIKFWNGKKVPLEMHRTRIVQKLHLLPVAERLEKVKQAGFNLYKLHSQDVFLDMLTDSGVNAMSDNQLAAMMNADDAYAGSRSFFELKAKVQELFGMEHFLPVHQGRAAEKNLADAMIKEGDIVPMNYHFTTTRSHIVRMGATVEEFIIKEGLDPNADHPFKGNFDTAKLEKLLREKADRVPFVRVEAGTNLIGGQPFSLANLREVAKIARAFNKPVVLDASLLQDNLYFIKAREAEFATASIREITKEIADLCDIIYFSARKLGFARGGGIALRDENIARKLEELVVLNEGFLTYGGMSVKEIAAITVGLEETMDFEIISQGPMFIEYMVNELVKQGVPVVTPAGGLGVHIDCKEFAPHLPADEYISASIAAALYIVGGIRGMERGTLSEDRLPDGSEKIADMELLRLAMPRRVFSLSQVEYAIDRVVWLFENRDLIGGTRFVREPKILRFFTGELEATSDWPEKLVEKFKQDFGESC